MPNHCENYLQIDGDDKNDVAAVLDAIAGATPIDFNKLIQYPNRFKSLDDRAHEFNEKIRIIRSDDPDAFQKRKQLREEYSVPQDRMYAIDGFSSGGYEWRYKNWGTKWNAYRVEIVLREEYQAIIKFETAWSPPFPVIAKLAEMFPQCKFTLEFCEPGEAYRGSAYYENGELKQSATSDYYGSI